MRHVVIVGLFSIACGTPPSEQAATPESAAVGTVTAAAPAPNACAHDSTWFEPTPPFKIHGNTWHVGPRGLGVFLITAPTGHVLIDGGIPGSAPLIEANIRTLGFEPNDIKWIAISHAHCDHAGDVAALAAATGAEVLAGAGDVELLARGGLDDPQYGNEYPYPPVRGARGVSDGEVLRLGDLALTAHLTPGHTRGNVTWAWTSCENGDCAQLVDVGSLSAPDYTLVDNAKHPTLIEDYEASFTKVVALRCDLALAPHPGMVDWWERIAARDAGDPKALRDPTLCRGYAEYARENFRKDLARQRGK